ncbi:RnfABCDGE type electron transport complex subunit G [Porphyromonas crevioricanis]|uniref:Ion-translocating oxidoreductase complex subunit G n=2 Tax=Porphyromonas crevioricanis TaxID=393921 RepID=A0A2X4PLU6_9PORP|nr:RnfABCDGE type electron transport complex subunit G [Porphyromonas crevioricanis]GAD05659.1 electron transport complex protein RnfG [Porphyromonas crevioricanis JCM 15906]GAD06545.1 electron transport complex protein RnfG [Porphyromonas crevioricanis JCM 13913]SJZ60275.1 electron transport complex protein RnfG [Porphyromonas crevioricanis]SQH72783.1 electron transport complex protein RnfG [Porphyromonas crevioricanis]
MKKLASTLPNMLLSLVGICLVVAAMLGGMYKLTEEPIKVSKEAAKNAAIAKVIPGMDDKTELSETKFTLDGDKADVVVYTAKKEGETIGYAVESYADGFGGKISEMVGFDTEGTIIDFVELENAETPGLGTKIPEWFGETDAKGKGKGCVKGIAMPEVKELKVSKDGGSVDAITAATISSRAFTDAVNRAYKAYQRVVTTNQTEGGN